MFIFKSILFTSIYYQNVDLQEIKPDVAEYQLEHGRCRGCEKRRSSKFQNELNEQNVG